MIHTTTAPETDTAEWDDTAFRHAYSRRDKVVALCGYAGLSTWRNTAEVPSNICPICLALLPEHWDIENKRWLP